MVVERKREEYEAEVSAADQTKDIENGMVYVRRIRNNLFHDGSVSVTMSQIVTN